MTTTTANPIPMANPLLNPNFYQGAYPTQVNPYNAAPQPYQQPSYYQNVPIINTNITPSPTGLNYTQQPLVQNVMSSGVPNNTTNIRQAVNIPAPMQSDRRDDGNLNCDRCEQCKDCFDCVNCVGCVRCYHCKDCKACVKCFNCDNVSAAENCIECRNCVNVQNCSNCDACNGCHDLTNSTNCTNIAGGDNMVNNVKVA